MVEQIGMNFDPQVHRQPPPVVPLRGDGPVQASAPPQSAPVPPPQQRLFTEPQPRVTPQYVAMARTVSQILATRVLLLIAVLTSSAIWSFAVWNPSDGRTLAATAFSCVTMWPLTILYWKKG